MSVGGTNVALNTMVASFTDTTVTLDMPLLGESKSGSTIVFTPAYPAGLGTLMQAWLSYPATVSGTVSSQSYQPGDDDTNFWPGQASAQPGAFLNLVLCALTQGYMIPPPYAVSLGDEITSAPNLLLIRHRRRACRRDRRAMDRLFPGQPDLGSRYGKHGSGDTNVLAEVHTLFTASSGGPSASFILATSEPTAVGDNTLRLRRRRRSSKECR